MLPCFAAQGTLLLASEWLLCSGIRRSVIPLLIYLPGSSSMQKSPNKKLHFVFFKVIESAVSSVALVMGARKK